MSYDIELTDPGTGKAITFESPHDFKGGIYALGEQREAWLNITYNYASFYYEHIDKEKGIRWLYGKTGKEAAPVLEAAIAALGTERSEDYWEATPGNAGAALVGLLEFARRRPDGVFRGD